jgi:hypothetical protein
MAEAALALTVIDLLIKITGHCVEYSTAVSNAKQDIERLHCQVKSLNRAVTSVHQLLDGQYGATLITSRNIVDSIDGCTSQLLEVERRLARHAGLRALRWPFDKKEIEKILGNLGRHEQTIALAMQVDQT